MGQSRSTLRAARARAGIGSRLWEHLQLWRQLPPWRLRARADEALRASGDLTTQPPLSRGQALREAHATLCKRLDSRPAVRQVLPHLAAIEHSLGRHGSRALQRLPVLVLHRGLTQLTLLQSDDDDPLDAASLRVLRLRLIEAIALRSAPAAGLDSLAAPPVRSARRAMPAPRGFAPCSSLSGGSALAQGMDMAEMSSDAYDEAERTPGGWRRH